MLRHLLYIFAIFTINAEQSIYKQSSDCPGNLKWSTTGTTIMGNGYGSKPNQLKFPQGIFIEPKTQILYVADVSNNRVQKRYPNGTIATAAGRSDGTSGATPAELDGPKDVFADEHENVFIADWSNQRIQLWRKNAKTGEMVAGDGTSGSGLKEFSYPSQVVVSSNGSVIVADYQNQRITQWSSKYDPKTSVGIVIAGGNGAGLNPYQLNGPTGLYFDEPNNILYIANEESDSVTQWYVGDYEPQYIYAGIPGRPGDSSVQLNNPQGIFLDKYGNLYVTDCMNNRIQMFCPDSVFGLTIAGTGKTGNASNQLYFPRDIAFDAEMNLYVTDTYNYRIQKFERIQ